MPESGNAPTTATAAVPGIDALRPSDGRLFVVVGVFDGLHRGHMYLIRLLRREAAKRRARPAVITFDAHPDEILRGAAPPLLLDPGERLERLAAAGVEVTVVQHFDVALRTTPYDAFVERIRARIDLAGFLMTPDAAFGYERRGTPDALSELGRAVGFEVVVVPPLEIGGRAIRSSDIRTAIAAGDLMGARQALGRDVAVVGSAHASEDGAATEIRFDLPMAIPPDGVYEVAVRASDGPAEVRRRLVIQEGTLRVEPVILAPSGSRVRARLIGARFVGGQ
jgi:riboflavin kinase / FMN adenylyltransferase